MAPLSAWTLGRLPYAMIAIGIVVADRAMAAWILRRVDFDRHAAGLWLLGNVVGPLATPRLSAEAPALVLTGLTAAALGVLAALPRLRSADWPRPMALLAVLPIMNLLLFAALSLAPVGSATEPQSSRSVLARIIPASPVGSAMFACVITAAFGVGAVWLAVTQLHGYGIAVFIALPLSLGFASTVVHVVHPGRTLRQCIGVSSLATTLTCMVLLLAAIEGILCVVMAAPLLYAMAALGALIAWAIVGTGTDVARGRTLAGILALQPPMLAIDTAAGPTLARDAVVDEITVAIAPDAAWERLKSIDAIDVAKPWVLYLGAPVPLYCTLERDGVGALRTCHFEQGVIEERVTEWDRPHVLRMEIVRNTLPGRSWLAFEEALYELHADSSGTRIVRTTVYTSALGPRWYWSTLERIGIRAEHRYLLDEIRRRAG